MMIIWLKKWGCRFKGHSMWEKMRKVQSRGCIVGKNVKWVKIHNWGKMFKKIWKNEKTTKWKNAMQCMWKKRWKVQSRGVHNLEKCNSGKNRPFCQIEDGWCHGDVMALFHLLITWIPGNGTNRRENRRKKKNLSFVLSLVFLERADFWGRNGKGGRLMANFLLLVALFEISFKLKLTNFIK